MGVTNRPRTEEGRVPTLLRLLSPLERKDLFGRLSVTMH